MVASPVITSQPCLWVEDLSAVVFLANRFAVRHLLNIPETLDQGLQTIFIDKNTPEVIVRKAIYRILASGNRLDIYQSQQPISTLAEDQSLSAGELMGQILEFTRPCEQWLERRSQEKLSLKDASEIAKVVSVYEQEPQRSVELGTLRVRCGESSYDWNKLMRELEKEFSQELQKRGITLAGGNKTDNVDLAKIEKDYIALLESVADDTAIEQFKIQSRLGYPSVQSSELNKLLDAITNKFLHEQAQADEASEIKNLVEATEETISIHDYLPEKLANPLAQYGHWQKLSHGVLLTSFLTAASSLHKVGTELTIHRGQNFHVVPTIFAAVVAESSAKKSPMTKATARDPLNILKTLDKETYITNLELYEAELAEWQEEKAALPKGEKMSKPEPQKPNLPPLYYFTDATGEGMKAQAASHPEKGLLGLFDELAGFFNSSNQYRGGKGSDKQDLLSYFDGVGATVLRASGIKADVNKIHLSILGTIQPEVLRKAMDNTNDVDGSWARFIFAIQPNVPGKLPDDDGSSFDMKDLIADIFRKIHELPIIQYRLSKEAFKLYQPCYNRLEQLRVSHPSSGMRTVYGKAEGIIGRLALGLHVLHELASERSPAVEIPVERMKQAISLMKYYIGQIKLIYAFVDDSTPVPQVLKVIELSKRKQLGGEDGWIKAKDIQNASSKKQRPKANEIREWITQAVGSGYGETRGEGVRLEFKAFTEELRKSRSKVGDGRSKVGSEPTVETLGISSFKEKVGSVGHSYDDSPTVKISQPIINDLLVDKNLIGNDPIVKITEPVADDLLVDKNLIGNEPTEPTNTPDPDTAPVLAVGCEPTFAPTVEPTFQNAQVDAVSNPSCELQESTIIGDSDQSTTVVNKAEKPDLRQWQVGDRANVAGEAVSVAILHSGSDSITILYEDATQKKVEIVELFRPELKPGDRVEFFNKEFGGTQLGNIKNLELVNSSFSSATIEYSINGVTSSVKISRIDSIKFLSEGGDNPKAVNSKAANPQPLADKSGGYTHR